MFLYISGAKWKYIHEIFSLHTLQASLPVPKILHEPLVIPLRNETAQNLCPIQPNLKKCGIPHFDCNLQNAHTELKTAPIIDLRPPVEALVSGCKSLCASVCVSSVATHPRPEGVYVGGHAPVT